MTYYKIICGDTFVGIGTTKDLRKHQKKHNLMLSATEDEAQCISINEELFKDTWMVALSTDEVTAEPATIKAITKEDYDALLDAMERGEEIEAAPEEEPEEEEVVEEVSESEAEEVTADYIRNIKIKEMSLACNKAITGGFDIELSDGVQHHFSMTLQDQANLNAASMQVLNGDSEVPYHADNEEYRTFSAEDMIAVIGAANTHKMRNLAYFGCLKSWLTSLVRIKSIQSVEYGSEIPKKYQSALYRNVCGG